MGHSRITLIVTFACCLRYVSSQTVSPSSFHNKMVLNLIKMKKHLLGARAGSDVTACHLAVRAIKKNCCFLVVMLSVCGLYLTIVVILQSVMHGRYSCVLSPALSPDKSTDLLIRVSIVSDYASLQHIKGVLMTLAFYALPARGRCNRFVRSVRSEGLCGSLTQRFCGYRFPLKS